MSIASRSLLSATVVLLLSGAVVTSSTLKAKGQAAPSTAQSAAETLLTLGPEGQALAKRAGTWDVTFTNWSKAGAPPESTSGLVAEREMIGSMLEERLHTVSGSGGKAWTRIDDLLYNRLDGRWDYMSMDTRAPVGLMPAYSLGRDPVDRIMISFVPFATPGEGATPTGQLLRMEEVIHAIDADHEVKDQYFMPADGVATKWLAKRYSYTRRRSGGAVNDPASAADDSGSKAGSR